ncbi:MAG TPA: hypothetical protein VFA46_16540 [Actinomycetes bacterium]|nr:hypothetical protein [Actinomycetes bacterium]
MCQPDQASKQTDEASPDSQNPGGRTRRRAPGADPQVRSFGLRRVCAADGCQTTLSRYNPDTYCSVHRGWDRQVVHRQRRNDVPADQEQ